ASGAALRGDELRALRAERLGGRRSLRAPRPALRPRPRRLRLHAERHRGPRLPPLGRLRLPRPARAGELALLPLAHPRPALRLAARAPVGAARQLQLRARRQLLPQPRGLERRAGGARPPARPRARARDLRRRLPAHAALLALLAAPLRAPLRCGVAG